jgi:ATP-dependent DNA helicase RecQ
MQNIQQILAKLNEDQVKPVIDTEGAVLVIAGAGSGKTRVLVHKLASLLLLEDVKHEQLLMLTFSRAAATEFKQRLMDLIGNAAHFVEIKTFHSYCFDLLGI